MWVYFHGIDYNKHPFLRGLYIIGNKCAKVEYDFFIKINQLCSVHIGNMNVQVKMLHTKKDFIFRTT